MVFSQDECRGTAGAQTSSTTTGQGSCRYRFRCTLALFQMPGKLFHRPSIASAAALRHNRTHE
jgi:hypothetical protein